MTRLRLVRRRGARLSSTRWARRRERTAQRILSPAAQIAYGVVVALFGGWLIGLWAVGLLLIVFAGLLIVDAVLRDTGAAGEERPQTRHDEILERWRNAR